MKTVPYGVATVFVLILSLTLVGQSTVQGADRYVGSWTLTLADGRPGWLGVEEQNGELSANILWGVGSVVPFDSAAMDGDNVVLTRTRKARARWGEPARRMITETITAMRAGKILNLDLVTTSEGAETRRQSFSGKWCPPIGPKPDLSKIRFGEPVVLFNGTSLDGWTLTHKDRTNGWSAQDAQLVNNPAQPERGDHIAYGNLRTIEEFEDFKLQLEVNVGERENSGIYLRGIYEIQISDSYGRDLDSHNMGAIYSRITPQASAERPAGEWQTMEITLLDRHVSVVLNGETIIDNEPVLGCTGGALWADPFRPGPIYLQGDHTGVRYRNIVLTPIEKR
jgi:hypothetical protein